DRQRRAPGHLRPPARRRRLPRPDLAPGRVRAARPGRVIRRSRPPRIPGGPAEERLRATAGATDPLGLAVRTAAAVEAVPSRRHPRWPHRQPRHGAPAWVPAGDLPLLETPAGRAWCTLGSLTGHRAHVAPAGLVAPDHGHWSVDWLVGAGDRWLVPAH